MPFVEIGPERIYYAARGERGVPLVFVHGSGGSHLIWNAQLAAASDLARAYALDLPGHGRSSGPGRRSVADYAEVLREWLDAVGLERAIIAGHSLGGAIALTLALESPERVIGLVLVGTGARLRVRPDFLQGLLTDFTNTAFRLNEASFAATADTRLKWLSQGQLLACDPQVVHDDYAACDEFDVMRRVGEIHVPTLILCGRVDEMTPPKYSEYLNAQIPNSQLELIGGAGHNVMVEQSEAVNHALRVWLMRQDFTI